MDTYPGRGAPRPWKARKGTWDPEISDDARGARGARLEHARCNRYTQGGWLNFGGFHWGEPALAHSQLAPQRLGCWNLTAPIAFSRALQVSGIQLSGK